MFNPIFYKDFYKVGHYEQYPKGTNLIFSNFTPRKSRIEGVDYSILFGLKYFIIKYLIEEFNMAFFSENGIPDDYAGFIKETLGIDNKFKHIESLKELGYLPIAIYAFPEGSLVKEKCPALVIFNTHPDFFWLTNMLETLMSCILWGASTSATVAHKYRCILDDYAKQTSDNGWFVDYQAHDFSFRGMYGLEAAMLSGAAHLLYFKGTDTIPALLFANKYYGKPFQISSVPATEHSTMCAGTKEDELNTYKRLLNELYPTGVVSIVSDTWDFWHVIDNFLPLLKNDIMQREGKCVIRPDSGDPIKIICGNKYNVYFSVPEAEDAVLKHLKEQAILDCEGSHNCGNSEYSEIFQLGEKFYKIIVEVEYNRHDKTYYYVEDVRLKSIEEYFIKSEEVGLIQRLWEIFGGHTNSKGFKELDSHIGAIYGDSITLDRCKIICEKLKEKGFASTNIVFGIGSYSYQYVTRDTCGWAMKATYAEINGESVNLFKDPKTDDGTKKSHKGLLKVIKTPYGYKTLEGITWDEFYMPDNELKLAFLDGKIFI